MTNLNKFSFYLLLVTTIFSFNAYGAEGDERPFEMLIRTTNDGLSSDTEFLIQTKDSGYSYDVDCDNDGSFEATGVTDNYTCRYTVADMIILLVFRVPFRSYILNFSVLMQKKSWRYYSGEHRCGSLWNKPAMIVEI